MTVSKPPRIVPIPQSEKLSSGAGAGAWWMGLSRVVPSVHFPTARVKHSTNALAACFISEVRPKKPRPLELKSMELQGESEGVIGTEQFGEQGTRPPLSGGLYTLLWQEDEVTPNYAAQSSDTLVQAELKELNILPNI